MLNNTYQWYTDLFNVYRVQQVTNLGITTDKRILVTENQRGRIYRKSGSQLNNQLQAAELNINDNLVCDINVDIKAGDLIEVSRGYFIGKFNGNKEQYIAGEPVDYYIPFGGISPDLEHKQVQLQNIKRSNGSV